MVFPKEIVEKVHFVKKIRRQKPANDVKEKHTTFLSLIKAASGLSRLRIQTVSSEYSVPVYKWK